MVTVTCVWPRESCEERKRLLLENSEGDRYGRCCQSMTRRLKEKAFATRDRQVWVDRKTVTLSRCKSDVSRGLGKRMRHQSQTQSQEDLPWTAVFH